MPNNNFYPAFLAPIVGLDTPVAFFRDNMGILWISAINFININGDNAHQGFYLNSFLQDERLKPYRKINSFLLNKSILMFNEHGLSLAVYIYSPLVWQGTINENFCHSIRDYHRHFNHQETCFPINQRDRFAEVAGLHYADLESEKYQPDTPDEPVESSEPY